MLQCKSQQPSVEIPNLSTKVPLDNTCDSNKATVITLLTSACRKVIGNSVICARLIHSLTFKVLNSFELKITRSKSDVCHSWSMIKPDLDQTWYTYQKTAVWCWCAWQRQTFWRLAIIHWHILPLNRRHLKSLTNGTTCANENYHA